MQHRRERILSEVLEHGHVTVADLSAGLDVSAATVRRDLKAMAGSGQIELVHGGAVSRRDPAHAFRARRMRNTEAKRIIGRLAAGLVADNSQIFIDSGTTCLEMASHLRDRRGLSIVVNSLQLAMVLDTAGLNVIVLGGHYRPERMDTIGPLTTAALEKLRGYVAFLGSDGLSMEFGLTANDIERADLYGLAVGHAKETILLADHTKFTTTSLYKVADLEAVSKIVTDREPSADWRSFLQDEGIELIHPDPDEVRGGDSQP
jgi:DeoR/GlpR family transcriptional regulator of sugar metabolism